MAMLIRNVQMDSSTERRDSMGGGWKRENFEKPDPKK